MMMSGKESWEVKRVTKEEYVEFYYFCAETLMPEEGLGREDVALEWDNDANGEDNMDMAAFYRALFELVGACPCAEYASLLYACSILCAVWLVLWGLL
jgi:hypothetical protein